MFSSRILLAKNQLVISSTCQYFFGHHSLFRTNESDQKSIQAAKKPSAQEIVLLENRYFTMTFKTAEKTRRPNDQVIAIHSN